VSIEMCREQGLRADGSIRTSAPPIDIQALRLALADDDVFEQEYMNVPIDSAMDFIPLGLVLACESEEAGTGFDFKARPGLFAGFDVARKRDLSVIWIWEERGDVLVTVGLIRMARTPFTQQAEMVERVTRCVERIGVDTTGLGAQIGEQLAEKFPDKVEQVNFAGTVEVGKDDEGKPIRTRIKESLAGSMKTAMESQLVLLPSEIAIRRAFQAVKRLITPTGYRLDSARTEAGHADEFWAAAIGRAMAASGANYVPASEVGLVGGRPIAAGLMGMKF
jgi:phage FluMu gp28-like protein